MQPTFYVTTPIYYITARPHLGTLYSTLLADVAARWNTLQGKKVFFVTGTDEHGQKIALAAEKAGMSPQEFVDSLVPAFTDCWQKYGISYNKFIRTTEPDHKNGVIQWINQLKETGDIYKGFYQGWYCTPCETFISESTEKAPACSSCGRITTVVQEETYFFRLSRYQDQLLAFYEKHPDFITPKERLHEIINFVKTGLRDLSISRTTLSWGIPFPGDPKHVVYVWADALINYLTAVGYGDAKAHEKFAQFWPAQAQILGKDIVRFHAIYWPAFLIAAKLPISKKLVVHGWIQVNQQKMSKSLGNAVDPLELYAQYGADPIRYYLVRYMAITQDGEFSTEDLQQKITSDCAHDLGNLLNRLLMLAHKSNLSVIHAPKMLDPHATELHKKIRALMLTMQQDSQDYFFHKMYAHAWKGINEINAYFHAQEPWKKARTDFQAYQAILSATAHALHTIALLIWPVMPEKMGKLLAALGCKSPQENYDHFTELLTCEWKKSFEFHYHIFSPQETLFSQYDRQESTPMNQNLTQNQPQDNSITIQDFSKVELRVGTIIDCALIEKSEKLYALTVDFGELGTRSILSGVRSHFTPEELIGKQGVFVYNLQPRKMVGRESQGMMLFALNESEKLIMTTVATHVPNGTRLQ